MLQWHVDKAAQLASDKSSRDCNNDTNSRILLQECDCFSLPRHMKLHCIMQEEQCRRSQIVCTQELGNMECPLSLVSKAINALVAYKVHISLAQTRYQSGLVVNISQNANTIHKQHKRDTCYKQNGKE